MAITAQPCDLRRCSTDADHIVLFTDEQRHVRTRFFCGPHHSQYQRIVRSAAARREARRQHA